MDASQEASTRSFLHLCLFSAVRFDARYVNCFWKSHRSSYGTGWFLKGNKKNEACIRWHRDINMGDLQWWKQWRMERESWKATARLKQAMAMWTKWSQDDAVGVKRDEWTLESSQLSVLIPLQTVKTVWLNLPLQTFGILWPKVKNPHVQARAHPPTYTPVTSVLCGWITHSNTTKISYPDKERSKLVEAAFQRSHKSWFFGIWTAGWPQRSDTKDIGMGP